MNRVKEYLILNACMLTFLLVMMWVRPIQPLRDYVLQEQMDFSDREFLFGDKTVSREFVCPKDADSFEILIIPAETLLSGIYRVDLTAVDGSMSVSWISHRYDMRSDGLMQYHIKGSKMRAGQAYRLTISAPELMEDYPVMVSLDDAGPDISIYDRKINIFAIAALIAVFVLANTWLALRDKGIAYYSLPVLVLSGFIMLFILAPGSGTDENTHYYWSYRLSNIILGVSDPSEVDNRYKYDFYMLGGIAGCNSNSSFIKTLNGLKGLEEAEQGSFRYDAFEDISYLSHMAPALGISLGRILNLNMIRIYTLGRIFNMLLYVFLAYLGIRLVPVNKELMLLLAMMPMCMQQCCSLSYDAMLNGVVFVYVGYIFKIVYEKGEFRWRNLILPVLLLIVILPIKYIYCVLAFLLILIAKDKIRLLIPVAAFSFLALAFVIRNYIASLFSLSNIPGDPMRYYPGAILHDPLRFIKACLLTMGNNLIEYCKGIVGSLMTGDFTVIPEYLVIMYITVILLCIFSCKERIVEERWQRWIVLGMFLTGTLFMLLAFAITQTLYSSPTISGLQGRYFIPILIPLVYCLGEGRIRVGIDRSRLFIPIWFVEIGYIVSIMNQIRVNL